MARYSPGGAGVAPGVDWGAPGERPPVHIFRPSPGSTGLDGQESPGGAPGLLSTPWEILVLPPTRKKICYKLSGIHKSYSAHTKPALLSPTFMPGHTGLGWLNTGSVGGKLRVGPHTHGGGIPEHGAGDVPEHCQMPSQSWSGEKGK